MPPFPPPPRPPPPFPSPPPPTPPPAPPPPNRALTAGLGKDRVDFVASGSFVALLVCLSLLLLSPLGYRGYVRFVKPPPDKEVDVGMQSEALTTTFYSPKDLRDYERLSRPALPSSPPKSPLALLWSPRRHAASPASPSSPGAIVPYVGSPPAGRGSLGGAEVWNPLSPERVGMARSQEIEARYLRSANAWQGNAQL